MFFEDERLENLIFALITGSVKCWGNDFDIWDHEPGVMFFANYILNTRYVWRHDQKSGRKLLIKRHGRV